MHGYDRGKKKIKIIEINYFKLKTVFIKFKIIQSPPKGATIPYRPKAALPPVIFANGQAYTIQGQYAVHQPDVSDLQKLKTNILIIIYQF